MMNGSHQKSKHVGYGRDSKKYIIRQDISAQTTIPHLIFLYISLSIIDFKPVTPNNHHQKHQKPVTHHNYQAFYHIRSQGWLGCDPILRPIGYLESPI